MELLKKIINILSYFVYILIIIYIVIELPMIFGYKPLVVLSDSMSPNYKTGDILYYYHVNKDEINKKDIITYVLSDGTYVSHRIIEKNDNTYITKGDANSTVDPISITYEKVLGKVSKVKIPLAGYYIKYVNDHTYTIGVFIVILVSDFLLSNVKNIDIKKRKER